MLSLISLADTYRVKKNDSDIKKKHLESEPESNHGVEGDKQIGSVLSIERGRGATMRSRSYWHLPRRPPYLVFVLHSASIAALFSPFSEQ